jgi:hypothetical protein
MPAHVAIDSRPQAAVVLLRNVKWVYALGVTLSHEE